MADSDTPTPDAAGQKTAKKLKRRKGDWVSVQVYAGKGQSDLVIYMNRANRDVLNMLTEAEERHADDDRSRSWIVRRALQLAGLDKDRLADEVEEQATQEGCPKNEVLLKLLRRHLPEV